MRLFGARLSSLHFYDGLLAAIVFVLSVIGFAAIYSVDLSRGGADNLVYFPKQFLAFCIGMALFFFCGRFHTVFYQMSARALYFISVGLLILALFFGQTIRGTRGWFVFGQFSFQPSELAKASLILMLGFLVARVGRKFDRIQYLIVTAIPTFILAGLVLLQPDTGSASVLVLLWFGILLATVKRKRYFAGLFLGILVCGLISWIFLFKPYQRERFLTFLDPARDPLYAGYNVTQSVIAVGAGRWTGRGLGFGSQSQLRFLPEAQTDFIFSVIAEELGFVGAGLVFVLYGALLIRLFSIARKCQNDFSAYTVIGIAWLFFIQISLNIGGAIGAIPLTGVTLPFLSYGGSSLIINFFLLGIVQSVVVSMKSTMFSASPEGT